MPEPAPGTEEKHGLFSGLFHREKPAAPAPADEAAPEVAAVEGHDVSQPVSAGDVAAVSAGDNAPLDLSQAEVHPNTEEAAVPTEEAAPEPTTVTITPDTLPEGEPVAEESHESAATDAVEGTSGEESPEDMLARMQREKEAHTDTTTTGDHEGEPVVADDTEADAAPANEPAAVEVSTEPKVVSVFAEPSDATPEAEADSLVEASTEDGVTPASEETPHDVPDTEAADKAVEDEHVKVNDEGTPADVDQTGEAETVAETTAEALPTDAKLDASPEPAEDAPMPTMEDDGVNPPAADKAEVPTMPGSQDVAAEVQGMVADTGKYLVDEKPEAGEAMTTPVPETADPAEAATEQVSDGTPKAEALIDNTVDFEKFRAGLKEAKTKLDELDRWAEEQARKAA